MGLFGKMPLPENENGIKSMRDRTSELYKTKKFSDCSFLVGKAPDQKLFEVHKFLLAIASPAYEAMFYGELAETKYPIEIPDVEPEPFALLMEYLYTDRAHIDSVDKAIALCAVAHTYMVTSLVKHCTIYCQNNLCADNVCGIYEFAKTYDLIDLKNSCVELIRTNINEILDNPGLVDIKKSTLLEIFEMDNLYLDRELKLFNALERYANAYEQKPKDYDDYREIVKTIKFLRMTPEEFATGPGCSKLLKEDEKLAIIMNLVSPSHKNYHMPEGFSTSQRRIPTSNKRRY